MKRFPEHISEELLSRYLANTATEADIDLINSWLKESKENQKELNDYRFLWEKSGEIRPEHFAKNTDAAWKKVQSQMNKETQPLKEIAPEVPVQKLSSTKKKWPSIGIWAAASVALLIMSYGWFLRQKHSPEKIAIRNVELVTGQNTKEQFLPDGTKVFLNYNSKLTFPETFEDSIRSVRLSGEAFFEVKSDSLHPFIIEANGTEVRVLGTSFNVKAYKTEPVRVDVASGKVAVRKASQVIHLIKGESATVVKDSVLSSLPDLNIMGYKTQVYDFEATEVSDIVTSIRNGYHIDLRLADEKTAQRRLTIRFEKEPVETTLAVIAETLDMKIRKDGQTYWLEP